MGLSDKKTTEEDKEQLKTDKKYFLEKVKSEKLKKLYNFPVQDDSDNKFSSSTNFFIYLTELNNIYLNYYNDPSVVYETTPYNLIGVDWMEYVQGKVAEDADSSLSEAMLAGPASRIVAGLSENKDGEIAQDKFRAVITLQNQETHAVRMFSFTCDQNEFMVLKVIPTKDVIEDKKIIDEESKLTTQSDASH